jgi:hypothetical protein
MEINRAGEAHSAWINQVTADDKRNLLHDTAARAYRIATLADSL